MKKQYKVSVFNQILLEHSKLGSDESFIFNFDNPFFDDVRGSIIIKGSDSVDAVLERLRYAING